MPDSTVDVTETIEVQFIGGDWHGIYRTIPVEYVTPQGFNYTLFIRDAGATDESGSALRLEASRQGEYLQWKIYIPNANDSTHTVALHYKVRNALRFFEDHDEFYWNITGNRWDVAIENASAHIALPVGVTGVRTVDYTGASGSRAQDAEITVSGNGIDVRMTRPLAFHEGLTIVAGWDKGFVKEPSGSDLVVQFLESNWPLFLPVIVFAFMFWLWYTRGRDPRVGAITVQYDAPEGLTPGEMGTLVDDSAAMRDITATLVDLAVRGYLVIEEKDKGHLMGLYSSKEYVFHLKKSADDWKGLKPHELLLLAGVFDNGGSPDVELSGLQNHFYKNIPPIRNSLFDQLMERGYFQHRPDYVRGGFLAGGIAAGALLVMGGNLLANKYGMASAAFTVAGVISGIIIVGFGWFMPARTASGAKTLSNVLGFEDFLSHVELGRMDKMIQTPQTFEKFLPFAMALGVEKKWVGAFQNIYTQPPSWYQGGYYGNTFYPLGFVNNLNAMTTHVGQVMTSAPRSSGSSGFGGGGMSGGGFGGGGGGGF